MLCSYLGAVLEHVVRLDSGLDVIVRGPGLGPDAARRRSPGERVSLTWSAAAERVFDEQDRPAPEATGEQTVMPEGEDEQWTG